MFAFESRRNFGGAKATAEALRNPANLAGQASMAQPHLVNKNDIDDLLSEC